MRIGLLGGTFDPIHNGHLYIAREVLSRASLDEVWFVVALRNPLKMGSAPVSFEDRVALVEYAIADEPRFQVCALEGGRPPPSYMIDTVEVLQDRFPWDSFFLIIGDDAAKDLAQWKRVDELLDKASLLVVTRDGVDLGEILAETPVLASAVKKGRLEIPAKQISATDLRRRLVRGEDVASDLPRAVLEEIRRRGLYQQG